MVKPSMVKQTAPGVEGKAAQHDQSSCGAGGHRTMSAQDERTWSVVAHLSMFLNLLAGFLGPVTSLMIYLVYMDRSSRAAFDALQSMWYQIGWLVVPTVGWILTTLLMVVVVGFLLIPVMIVVSMLPFAHAAYAAYTAYNVNQGVDYRYPIAADLAQRRYKGDASDSSFVCPACSLLFVGTPRECAKPSPSPTAPTTKGINTLSAGLSGARGTVGTRNGGR
ncbi:MAG TPA: DUF4870 domain-containing protein [Rubrobacteraceae bacterium]|nr:DUF4870 domain-containing protein [Rubrobacteraceae bacterium]